MKGISDWAIPCVLFAIVLHGYLHSVNVFEVFLTGAREGLRTAAEILPALVALIASVGVFKASGALDLLTAALSPAMRLLGLPAEVLPLALLRPVSGSGAMVIFTELLSRYGPDSTIGRIASVLEGSTETTFYTIAVYFGAAGIRKTRHTAPAAVTADLVGFVMSGIAVRLLFR